MGSAGAVIGVALADAVGATVGVRIITSIPGPGNRVGTIVGGDIVGNGDVVGTEVATVLSTVGVSSGSDPAHATSATAGMPRNNHMWPVMDENLRVGMFTEPTLRSGRQILSPLGLTRFLKAALPG